MPRVKKSEYNQYMRDYMRVYRAGERRLLNLAKQKFGWSTQKQRDGGQRKK